MASGSGLLKEITVVPVIDTAIYAANDVLFAETVINDVARVDGGNVALNSVSMMDVDDETGLDIDLVFFSAAPTVDVANAAFTGLTDAELLTVVGHVNLTTATDAVFDAINGQYYQKEGLAIQMQCAATDNRLWVVGILAAGTPTFAAATDLTFRFGFTQD